MSIGDSSSLINSWKQRYKESAVKSEDSKSITDGIVAEALPIFEKSKNPEDNAILFKALKEFELTDDQKQKVYSALAKTPLSFSQVHKIDEGDIPCEHFSDIYEIYFGDEKLEISRAELSTLGDYFTTFLNTEFSQRKKIIMENVGLEQFKGFRSFIAGKSDEYDVNDPETWLALKNIADYFQAPDMDALLPKFPKFANAREAIEFAENNVDLEQAQALRAFLAGNRGNYDVNDPETWLTFKTIADNSNAPDMGALLPKFPEFANARDAIEFAANNDLSILDLSQFRDGVTGTDLVIISEYLDRKEAPSLSHLKELVIRYAAAISSKEWQEFLPKLPQDLKRLDLTGCNQLTEACISNLPEGITALALSECSVRDAWIPKLPRGIEKLDLAKCKNLTDACIPDLPGGITKLDLLGCNLTRAGLKSLWLRDIVLILD